jgi:protocatechuate 3,4-dioxygenase alpha subunit
MTVFARGLADRLFTRVYVPSPALAADRFLTSLPEDRRPTPVATRSPLGLTFDVRLQGEGETVFLRYPAAPGDSGQ